MVFSQNDVGSNQDSGDRSPNGSYKTHVAQAGATAVDDGAWLDNRFGNVGSLEVNGISSGTVQVRGSNQIDPPNSDDVTFAGATPTAGQIVKIKFSGPKIANGAIEKSYTIQNSDTATLVAAGLEAVCVADTVLAGLGFKFSISGAVLTFTLPNYRGPITVTTTSAGGVTLTVSVKRHGYQIGSNITTNGITQITGAYRWIKVIQSAYNGDNVQAILHVLKNTNS